MTETTCQYCNHDVLLDGCAYAQDADGNIVSCDNCVKILAQAMGMADLGGNEPPSSVA